MKTERLIELLKECAKRSLDVGASTEVPTELWDEVILLSIDTEGQLGYLATSGITRPEKLAALFKSIDRLKQAYLKKDNHLEAAVLGQEVVLLAYDCREQEKNKDAQ